MSESQDPSQSMNGGLFSSDHRLKRKHQDFVRCLERHGPDLSGDEWPTMAEELGWSIEEVQLYAYQYLASIIEVDDRAREAMEQTTKNGSSRAGEHAEEQSIYRSWSREESIRFDALIAAFRARINTRNSHDSDWDQQIASHLPGRTPQEVRRRYFLLHGKSVSEIDR